MNDHLIAKLSEPAPAAVPTHAAAEAVPAMLALPCTLCVVEAKQAAARKADEVPEPLPGAVMLNGMLLCDVRHAINVGAPSLLIAQPGQMPGGAFGG